MGLLQRAGLAGVAVAGVVFGDAGVALADDRGFLDRIHDAGFTSAGGDDDLLSNGVSVCNDLAGGRPAGGVVEEIWFDSGVEREEAVEFVEIAVDELCPDQWAAINSAPPAQEPPGELLV